jgi:branched-chain amino acid transport system substrate-binding protein
VNTDDCEDPAAATKKVSGTWTIGYSLPLSGPVAGAVTLSLDGFKGRIDALNAAGGVNGVKIKVLYKDDQFTPDRAKANATQFLQSDHVDSLITFGDGAVGAMADDQNAACVPLLYPSSSDATYRSISQYPWTVPFLPDEVAEAKFDVKYIQSKFPSGATVGIIQNPDAAGVDEYNDFKSATAGTNIKIVAHATTADPNAAATVIASAKPDVVFIAGITTDCGPDAQAMSRIGFTPKLEVNPSNCADAGAYTAAGTASDGNVIAAFLKDPSDPALAADPGVVEYLSQVTKADKLNAITVSGWVEADLLVNTLKQAAASPAGLSHVGVIEAARDQNYPCPMFPNGSFWLSTPTTLTGVTAFQAAAWSATQKRFITQGKPIAVGG